MCGSHWDVFFMLVWCIHIACMFGKCIMVYEYLIYSIDMCLDPSIWRVCPQLEMRIPCIWYSSHPVTPPLHRTLQLNILVQCAPLSAQQRAALTNYWGPATCMSISWTLAFGGCTFSGDHAGAPLVRTGSCPTQGGWLVLSRKDITSVPAGAFADMTKMEWVPWHTRASLREHEWHSDVIPIYKYMCLIWL